LTLNNDKLSQFIIDSIPSLIHLKYLKFKCYESLDLSPFSFCEKLEYFVITSSVNNILSYTNKCPASLKTLKILESIVHNDTIYTIVEKCYNLKVLYVLGNSRIDDYLLFDPRAVIFSQHGPLLFYVTEDTLSRAILTMLIDKFQNLSISFIRERDLLTKRNKA